MTLTGVWGAFVFWARLTCFYCFASRLRAIRLGAGKPDHIPLSVETGNKHWAVVGIAVWLVRTNERWLTAFWRHISQPFAKAALTKLRGTSAKLNRVICTEGRKAKLHCPIMFIAEGQNICAHGSSLAPSRDSPTIERHGWNFVRGTENRYGYACGVF